MATLDKQPWYCGSNTVWDTLFGCDSYLPTSQDQVAMMRANFGPGMDSGVVDQATNAYQDWLTTVNYDGELEKAKGQVPDSLNPFKNVKIDWTTVLLGVGIVGFAVVALGSGGPRRYGR